MMDAIAGMAMDLNAAKIAQSYSLALTEKAMDSQELAAQELLRMLPPTPNLGGNIDTYA